MEAFLWKEVFDNMNERVQEKNGFKYVFVTNKNIKFLPEYKEFECTNHGQTEQVYLIGVIPNPYDFNDDLCLVLPLRWLSKMTDEQKEKQKEDPIGSTVKGSTLKGYKKFIIPFYPAGM